MSDDINKSNETAVIASTASTGKGSSRHKDVIEPTSDGKKKKSKPKKQPSVFETGQNQLAKKVSEQLENTLAHDVIDGQWYRRSGDKYEQIPDAKAKQQIQRELEAIHPSFSFGFLTGVTEFVKSRFMVNRWTDNSHEIALKNGVFNIKDKALRQYKPTDRFRNQLPFAFDENAKCPDTEMILFTLANDDADIFQMLLACMYCVLLKRYDLQKYFELIGPGGTGKSTFIDLLTLLVGDCNRAVTDLKELENNRFESAALYRKYLAVITDSAQWRGDVAKLKALTGGDPIRNEVKNRQQSEPFIFTGIVFIATNEPITSKDYTDGLSRRRIPVYFTHKITDADKAQYPDGINAVFNRELSGILNLVLAQDADSMVDLIVNPSDTMAAAKLQTELDTNPLLKWADDFLIQVGEGNETPIGQKDASPLGGLYASYCAHCDNSGNSAVSLNRFSNLVEQQLQSRDIPTRRHRRSHSRVLEGLALRSPNDGDIPTLLSGHSMTA